MRNLALRSPGSPVGGQVTTLERRVYWDGTTWLPARGPGEFETVWQRAAVAPDVPSLLMLKVF